MRLHENEAMLMDLRAQQATRAGRLASGRLAAPGRGVAGLEAVDEERIETGHAVDVDPEGVIWEDGYAKPAGANVGDFKPLSLREIAAKAAATGCQGA